MKEIMHRIGSALALRLAGLENLRREEQQIYRNALRKRLAGDNRKAVKVQKVPVLNWQDELVYDVL